MAIAERIKQARLMAGLSLRSLAERVDVSATAISKYETGKDVPSSGVLIRLAKSLDVKAEYFLRHSPISVEAARPCYRKETHLPRKQEKAIQASIGEWLERYIEIEDLRVLGKKPDGLPSGPAFAVSKSDDVESAADALREHWQLGSAPIENLTELLEDKGVKVGLVDAGDEFEACTFWVETDGRMPVIATRKGLYGDRQRFNLAHELGHLVLKPSAHVDVESTAHRFAGAFLAPAASVRAELGLHRRHLSVYELHMLKHKYGLSMQAWVHRAQELGIIADSRAKAIRSLFRARDWRRTEPGEQCPEEHPTRFELLVMQALAEDVISEAKAAELLGKPLSEFRAEVAAQHGEFPVGAGN
jgi:Zn-dependent peptidase ImmA (M78 family)/DNA-binding XRE family transcriptional regulator